MRAVAGIVVTLPEPAISRGQPSLPEHWARFAAVGDLIEGPDHIHAIPDPNPIWNPATSGWTVPPPLITGGGGGGVGDFRWSVDSLPDPGGYPGGWYWLGDVRVAGESHAVAGNEWSTAPGGPAGPAWRSFYPYRPSVSAYDAYIPGERLIHHARGVHCNSHYVEHMWLDFGSSQTQPFTWIVVATVMSDPFPGYQHAILDAGRNPDDVGFPRLGAGALSTERRINDNLPYRTSLTWTNDTAQMQAIAGEATLRTRAVPGHHPSMYAAIFNGEQSQLAVYDPFGKYLSAGRVGNGAQSSHRFTILGREQGWISQRYSSNVLVFEIRYWHHALSVADLESQYAQLSSTHQFDQYKRL